MTYIRKIYNKKTSPESFKSKQLLNRMVMSETLNANLEKEFKFKVYPFDYRQKMKHDKPIDVSYGLLNEVIEKEIDLVIICGGQQLVAGILAYIDFFSPKTKVYN